MPHHCFLARAFGLHTVCFAGLPERTINVLVAAMNTKCISKMDTLGIEATPEEVDLMIDEIDQDHNGEIDFEGAIMMQKPC